MTPNKHPETGVAYGVIGSQVLDAEIVDTLIYGGHIKNLTYDAGLAEWLLARQRAALEDGFTYDEMEETDAFAENYERHEDTITGTYEGVTYATSWIGGALHFFITFSPFIKACRQCSPCCPGAGDLHSEGDMLTYNVPPDWIAS